MSVRVRLTRVGSKKNPIWRVVVADQRSPRDGRFIETIGQYNPQTHPSTIRIDEERLQHWLARGAQASNTVKQLMKAQMKSGGPTPEIVPAPAAPAEAAEAAGRRGFGRRSAPDADAAPTPPRREAEAAPAEPAAADDAPADEPPADDPDS